MILGEPQMFNNLIANDSKGSFRYIGITTRLSSLLKLIGNALVGSLCYLD
jgi:hypothetical protein